MARTVDVEHVSKPRRPGLCRVLRRSGYWKCLSCSLLLVGCGFYAAWCHFKHMAYSGLQPLLIYHHGPCAQGYNFVPIVFGLMLYIVYVMECWHSRSKLSTIKKVRVEDAMQYLKSLRNALPIVWWKSVCYHYVRKTRQVTRYRNGDAVPATQVYYERVDSHSAGNVFIYDVCGVKDISKTVLDLERFPLTRVRVTRGFVFACMQAAREFEQQRTRFFNENETRDDYMEVREGMDLSDVSVIDDMLVFRGSPPWFLRASTFWFFSLILLSWPLRIYAECRTAMLNYQVTKLFGTCYLSPSSVNYTGPLTRTSTMETVELEAALGREQYFVVPSYSEAMLMPNATVTLVNPTEARVFSHPIPVNNEQIVLRNYGALDHELGRMPAGRPVRPLSGSRSMSFMQAMRRDSVPRFSRAIPLRSSRRAPPRSLSIGGLTGWSNGYQAIGASPASDRTPLLDPPDEPPPSYEVALRMCAPLYDRLRRSISSRLNSLSQSSSKELKSLTGYSNGNSCSRHNSKDRDDHGPNVP
uniref:Transmembrane protein 151A n=1 Tax=Haemonchus contortus TaxID=6289 RepID=A0A7I4Y5X4_HAECO